MWFFEGSPGDESTGAAWGEYQEGRKALTVLAWVRPNPLDIQAGINGLWQSTVNTSAASKMVLYFEDVAGTWRVSGGGRSNDGGTFNGINGNEDIFAAPYSDSGRKWIHVGATIDPSNDQISIWINGGLDRTASGPGFNFNSFDNSHNTTRIGRYQSFEANSWIYSFQWFGRGLSTSEVNAIYKNQKGFFILNSDKGRIS
jgi:hypothetical protein